MFKSICKKLISKITQTAVIIAEQEFGSGKGSEKKAFAVKYVLKKLSLPAFIYNPLYGFLLQVVDEAIEYAVFFLKNRKNVQ